MHRLRSIKKSGFTPDFFIVLSSKLRFYFESDDNMAPIFAILNPLQMRFTDPKLFSQHF